MSHEDLIYIVLTTFLLRFLQTKVGAALLEQAFSLAKNLLVALIIVSVVRGGALDKLMDTIDEEPPTTPSLALTSAGVDWVRVWPAVVQWRSEIESASKRCNVDPALVAAVMRQESIGDPSVCSKAGACGLMQLMPATAKEVRVADRFDPAQNVRGGACYLRQMLDRYGGDVRVALAAYNAGPGNVDKYGGVPPFAETQKYVRRVTAFYREIVSGVSGGSGCCIWPTTGRITQGASADHMAIDIAATIGTPVVAAAGGKVIAAASGGNYGKRVMIDHGGGLLTLYAHLSQILVREGDRVNQGQIIGKVGSTGLSTGPHLHFEIREAGQLLDPFPRLR